jgi:hypothetical protein
MQYFNHGGQLMLDAVLNRINFAFWWSFFVLRKQKRFVLHYMISEKRRENIKSRKEVYQSI